MHLDGGDVLRGRTIILACGVSWRRLAIEGFDRLVGKGISYGAARSEAFNVHGLDVHIVGAGNSAGQSAMFFSTHARSVTILCRGDGLEKSMSSYLIDQLKTRPNIEVLTRTQVKAAHGETALEAIDATNEDTGMTTRIACGGLFIFTGADARIEWLLPEIALDTRRLRSHRPDVAASGTGSLSATRTCSRRACGHLRVRRHSLQSCQASCGGGRRREHGDRVRAPVPQASRPRRGGRLAAGVDALGVSGASRPLVVQLVAVGLARLGERTIRSPHRLDSAKRSISRSVDSC